MRYSISAFYKHFIKEKIFKDFLQKGKVPTQSEIEEELDKTIKAYNDLSSPLLSFYNYFIQSGETSSAKKINETFKTIESDLSVCVSAVIEQEKQIADFYDSNYSKITGLQNKIMAIKEDVDKILFESKNTDTHEELFYEKFSSKEMVDQELTTADVDEKIKEVTLKSTEQYYVDLKSTGALIQINPEINSKIVNSGDVGEMKITNILESNNKVWMYQVSASEALPSVSVDVIVRIPAGAAEVSKIVFEPHSVNLKTQMSVEVSFSSDGLNWTFPDGEKKKRLEQTTSLTFKMAKYEYWKIKFTKLGNDGFFSDFFVYNFGLKSLNFYGKKYDKISRLDIAYFYSKPFYFKNSVEMANIKICHVVPQNTKINYLVAPIYSSQVPLINNKSLSPKDLYYYQLEMNDRDSATVDFLNTESSPVSEGIVVNESLSYKDKGQYDYCLDALLPTNYTKTGTTLLRNQLNQDLYDALGIEKKINLKSSGWAFDGDYYSTYVLIEKNDGVEIDLGSTEMYINNLKVQGKVLLQKGLSFIVTHRDNWFSLDLSSLPVESDASIDPIYPYNHKYLIEGLGSSLYGQNLNLTIEDTKLIDIIDKQKAYPRNQNKCWAVKMKELDFSSFVSKNKNELDVFSYKIDNTNQERIVVKSDPDLGLITNETFSIITKLHSAENIKGLIFKAILETDNKDVSPILTEYLVKVK